MKTLKERDYKDLFRYSNKTTTTKPNNCTNLFEVVVFEIIIIFIVLLVLGLFLQKNISFFEDIKIDSMVKLILLGGLITIFYAILTYILKIPEIRSIINFRKKHSKIK